MHIVSRLTVRMVECLRDGEHIAIKLGVNVYSVRYIAKPKHWRTEHRIRVIGDDYELHEYCLHCNVDDAYEWISKRYG